MSYGPLWEEGYAAGRKVAADEIERLHIERDIAQAALITAVRDIERLRREKAEECAAKVQWNQRFITTAESIEQAAAFLDGLAAKLEDWPAHTEPMRRALDHAAADCRAMAAKLRERP
jgi:phage tail tape-measure protein